MRSMGRSTADEMNEVERPTWLNQAEQITSAWRAADRRDDAESMTGLVAFLLARDAVR